MKWKGDVNCGGVSAQLGCEHLDGSFASFRQMPVHRYLSERQTRHFQPSAFCGDKANGATIRIDTEVRFGLFQHEYASLHRQRPLVNQNGGNA